LSPRRILAALVPEVDTDQIPRRTMMTETPGAVPTDPRDADLAVSRKALWAALDDIVGGLHRAGIALDALVSPGVYDLDYAEAPAVDDMRRFLEDAARMVRAAQALNPARPETA
jgi:hypothetical protein